jgi:5-methylcytosine-specific restriction endonuclease McrA
MAPRRDRLLIIQGGLCAHCGKAMKPKHASLEHVIPRADGGTDAWTNLMVAHKWCNVRRGVDPLWRRGRKMHATVLAALNVGGSELKDEAL